MFIFSLSLSLPLLYLRHDIYHYVYLYILHCFIH
jgi:hypothetical protein